jgi:hypothetical protein
MFISAQFTYSKFYYKHFKFISECLYLTTLRQEHSIISFYQKCDSRPDFLQDPKDMSSTQMNSAQFSDIFITYNIQSNYGKSKY